MSIKAGDYRVFVGGSLQHEVTNVLKCQYRESALLPGGWYLEFDPSIQTNLEQALFFVSSFRFGIMDITTGEWEYVGVRFQSDLQAQYHDLYSSMEGERGVFRGTDVRGYLAARVVEPYYAAQSHYTIAGNVGAVVTTLMDDQSGVGAIPTARRFPGVTYTPVEVFNTTANVNGRFRYSNMLDTVRSLLDQYEQQEGEAVYLRVDLDTNTATGAFDGWNVSVGRYGVKGTHKLYPRLGDVSERAMIASARANTWAYVLGDGTGHTRTLRENSDAGVTPSVSGFERLEHVLDLGQSGASNTEIDGFVKGLFDPGYTGELITPGPDAPNMNVGDTVETPDLTGGLITHRVTEKLTTIEDGKVLRQYQLSGTGNSDPLVSNDYTLPDYA